MKSLSRLMPALAFGLFAVAPAMASPEGMWELETRDTRFELHLCGDGTRLCGKLAWLSDADYNIQYLPYLDRPMAEQLTPVAPGKWRGALQIMGHRLNGTVTQRSANHMTLSGCAFLVVCKTYEMYRVTP